MCCDKQAMAATSRQVRALIDGGVGFPGIDILIIDVTDPADLTVDQWVWLVDRDNDETPTCCVFSDEGRGEFCLRAARGDAAEAERLRRSLEANSTHHDLADF